MIVVSPEQISEKGRQIVHMSMELQRVIMQVHQQVGHLSTMWEGAAKSGYMHLYDNAQQVLKDIPNIVYALGEAAIHASETFQETDHILAKRLNS